MVQYTFLPFLRRGIVAMAKGNSGKNRLTVPLRLQVLVKEESQPAPIEQSLELIGPGDITGLNPQAIVRTIPRSGVNDYEANFLAAIEFYEEDFPWRYSPATPEPGGKLKPWLWLVVLRESEFKRTTSSKSSLPIIHIQPDSVLSAFPEPNSTSSWAHVHLNFKPENSTSAKALGSFVKQKLEEDPNLGCSRLVCPRRLAPNTRYYGFLVPAFEKGRLAGLGSSETEIDEIPNLMPSWANGSSALNKHQFPVYYDWSFTTSSEGDFEDLARKLSPLSTEEQKELTEATKAMDVRNPGWGIDGAKGSLRLESALKLPGTLPDSDQETLDKQELRNKLSSLLNLGINPLKTTEAKSTPHPYFTAESDSGTPSNLEDDPIITPPVYGGFHRPSEPFKIDSNSDWYAELNLNPIYRIAASQGTQVVQKDQEELMDRAWEQWGPYADSIFIKKRWIYSERISQIMCNKRMEPLTEVNDPTEKFRTLSFFSPMIASMQAKSKETVALKSLIPTKAIKPSTITPAFAKTVRNNGPLMRRVAMKPKAVFLTGSFNFSGIILPKKPPIEGAIEGILNWIKTNPRESGFLKDLGLGGKVELESALKNCLPLVKSTNKIQKAVKSELPENIMSVLWKKINPSNTIMARFESMILPSLPLQNAPFTNLTPAPVFEDATYSQLAERNRDFILPGLEKIPSNRVVLLESNTKFIESYLVGLNHEMSREFLWREFPAPLNATYFRNFWDNKNSVGTPSDILPIELWPIPSSLGSHSARKKQENAQNPLVLVIRGDLLRKYPNTEIFMVKAGWESKKNGRHKPSIDLESPSPLPLESKDIQRPLFSARLEPDYSFLGFNLNLEEVKGNSGTPGWFFVLKERAGDSQFGLDLHSKAPSNDPSWDQLEEIKENQCIQIDSSRFEALPRSGKRSDQLASMLFQKPFMLFVHASRLLP